MSYTPPDQHPLGELRIQRALERVLLANVTGEVPAGLVNGTNNAYTLSEDPDPQSVAAYVDGARVVAFTQAGRVLTFTTPPAASIVIDYRR